MPHLIGIAGGTASGKSTLARRIARALTDTRCATVSQDNYYRDLSGLSVEARAAVNFDHPESIDALLFAEHLRELRAGRAVTAPRYDFAHHARLSEGEVIEPRPVILVEGILVFVFPEVVEQLDVRHLVVSFNNEGHISREEMVDLLSTRGEVFVLERDFKRYVGAQIGIYNPDGDKVGQVSHLKNKEYLFIVPERPDDLTLPSAMFQAAEAMFAGRSPQAAASSG